MMTADTETAGFYGPLRVVGWYDGEHYDDDVRPDRWWEAVNDTAAVCYFHNLDFDLRKLESALRPERFPIDFPRSLKINNRLVRVKFRGYPAELADSYALLPASLERLCASFDLPPDLKKQHLDWAAAGYRSLEEFFAQVPVDDPAYRDYLRHDVLALYALLEKLRAETGFSPEAFQKIPTASSLALKTFARLYPFEYQEICRPKLSPTLDQALRRALSGGRTEVFRTRARDAEHYDVNGLYPYVMAHHDYPCGYPATFQGAEAKEAWHAFQAGYPWKFGHFTATVHVPAMPIPPLPWRYRGRLLFPVGTFTGDFVGAELQYAVACGASVVEVETAYVWRHGRRFFGEWGDRIAEEKAHATGARREVWKRLGNGSFGKFAMERVRVQTWDDTPENRAKAEARSLPYTTWYAHGDFSRPYLDVLAPVWAPYVQPQIGAHITAYARITLHRMLVRGETEFGGAVYADTDSIVTRAPIDPEEVHPTEAGRWKHEGHVVEGLYLSPKFYAERLSDGQEVLRSKGLVERWKHDAHFALYAELYERLAQEDFDRDPHGKPLIWLYQREPALRPYLSAVRAGADPNLPAHTTKALRPATWSKRRMDYRSGETAPWDAEELLAEDEEAAFARMDQREQAHYLKALRRRLWQGLMPRGLHDRDYPELPRAILRHHGIGLDVAATELGYDGPDALYRDLVRVFKT